MKVEWVFPLGSETTVLIVVIGEKTQNQRDIEFTENVNYMKFFQQWTPYQSESNSKE